MMSSIARSSTAASKDDPHTQASTARDRASSRNARSRRIVASRPHVMHGRATHPHPDQSHSHTSGGRITPVPPHAVHSPAVWKMSGGGVGRA